MKLRPAQQDILSYNGGRMAVSAVPGSGKTYTLALLAAKLISNGRLNVAEGQQVLVVTYLNSSVDTFRARIRNRLEELSEPLHGFDVRTLHSLALEIVRVANFGSNADSEGPIVADEVQVNDFLSRAVDSWISANPTVWRSFLREETPQLRARWRDITERTARSYIRLSKNERLQPNVIWSKLRDSGASRQTSAVSNDSHRRAEREPDFTLLWMLTGIYDRYQSTLVRQGALDFDDLIWQAADLLENRPDLALSLRERWPFVLEDEAQDSVPLQEVLLKGLTGPNGNWVRVGDPNQAITSTFTAAHPRHFNAFIDQPSVTARPLPNSGRCAPLIFEAANTLVSWVCDSHPVLEVRRYAFRRQRIEPTPPGDAQPNPSDLLATFSIKVYSHREDEELPFVAGSAVEHAGQNPEQTLAILVPTHEIGHELAEHLDARGAKYDNLLRGGSRIREIACALHALLAILSDPQSNRNLVSAYGALQDLGHQAATNHGNLERILTLLRSVHSAETFLFPSEERPIESSLPLGVATQENIIQLENLASFLARLFELRHLPIDDLILTLADEIFAPDLQESARQPEADLAIAYQIAGLTRQWRDLQPDWRLPELVAQLAEIAEGRRRLPVAGPGETGYEPEPGRITLTTQHGAKGLEWDSVFIIGVDGFWIPGSLEAPFLGSHEFLGGDPSAEASAQLRYLANGDAGLFPGRTATESAHIEVIGERLRLLYVGLTRARINLFLSRSRTTRRYNRDREAEPATVIGVLYQYLKERHATSGQDWRHGSSGTGPSQH